MKYVWQTTWFRFICGLKLFCWVDLIFVFFYILVWCMTAIDPCTGMDSLLAWKALTLLNSIYCPWQCGMKIVWMCMEGNFRKPDVLLWSQNIQLWSMARFIFSFMIPPAWKHKTSFKLSSLCCISPISHQFACWIVFFLVCECWCLSTTAATCLSHWLGKHKTK